MQEKERNIGKPMYKWKDNIRMNPKEIDVNVRNLIDSSQDWDFLESTYECSIESPDSTSHGIS